MNKELPEQLRRLTIIALSSDNSLLDVLVLKGGNALEIVHKLGARASYDIDYSMEQDFSVEELPSVENRIKHQLKYVFGERGYIIIDFKMKKKPEEMTEDFKEFWGGYSIEFKVFPKAQSEEFEKKMREQIAKKGVREHSTVESRIHDAYSRNALPLGKGNSPKLLIDISSHEYCGGKEKTTLDGQVIYVYSPALIALEKLRAICQQMREYAETMQTHPTQRARDFYDIHTICTQRRVTIPTEDNADIARKVFGAKKVPLHLVGAIRDSDCLEHHRAGFSSLKDTLPPGVKLETFDYYHDFVSTQAERLKSLWNI